MARYPGAEWRRLPGSEPAITPSTVIFHTMVGTLPGTDAYFRSGRSWGIESHFGVGGPWEGPEYDGVVWQWRDTEEQADANYHANGFAISIETSDGGDPSRPWSAKQLAALVRLGNWLAATHGIPRRICRTATDSGFGWHVMFGAPGPWTPSAKTCPGATRIAQLKAEVLPAIFADQPPQEVPDVTDEQARQLKAIYDGLTVPGTTSPEETVNLLFARVRSTETRTVEMAATLDGLVAGGGAVDIEALATAVADKLAARLAE